MQLLRVLYLDPNSHKLGSPGYRCGLGRHCNPHRGLWRRSVRHDRMRGDGGGYRRKAPWGEGKDDDVEREEPWLPTPTVDWAEAQGPRRGKARG